MALLSLAKKTHLSSREGRKSGQTDNKKTSKRKRFQSLTFQMHLIAANKYSLHYAGFHAPTLAFKTRWRRK
jgi:hypothetical protein